MGRVFRSFISCLFAAEFWQNPIFQKLNFSPSFCFRRYCHCDGWFGFSDDIFSLHISRFIYYKTGERLVVAISICKMFLSYQDWLFLFIFLILFFVLFIFIFFFFLDAFSHLYKRVCPSVVRSLLWNQSMIIISAKWIPKGTRLFSADYRLSSWMCFKLMYIIKILFPLFFFPHFFPHFWWMERMMTQ